MSHVAPRDSYPPIDAYAIVGNCRSAALISTDGSVDWLCWPRFDSPSTFAALLDRQRGGCFRIGPATSSRSHRRYLPDTTVLETTFEGDGGVLRLLDLMPVATEQEKRLHLWPDHQLLRVAECVAGEVEVEVRFEPRPNYAAVRPHLRTEGALGLFYEHGGAVLTLETDFPLQLAADRAGAGARVRLRAGERRWAALNYSQHTPAILTPPGGEVDESIRRTTDWWRRWVAGCSYDGPWSEAVRRSALVLKLLTFAPSGAVIAAPTTSLPEWIGGVRNWDYRFCWLRDASLTVRALLALGYAEEATAFLAWMLHTTRLTWPELQVLYDVYGNTHVRERTLDWLEGYGGSRPVRVGNAAHDQVQLDVYGEVVDAALRFVVNGGRLDRLTGKALAGFGETVCRRWSEPDQGIWEERAEPRHHTFSKVMCWVALDRLVQLHDGGHVRGPVERWRHERARIRAAVEEHGYDCALGSYVTAFGVPQVDASLLQLANFEYVRASDPRMRGTIRRVREELGSGHDHVLICRYRHIRDGFPPGQGAWGICSFWAVEALARAGELDTAEAEFERLLGYGNDLGLFAEQIDPATGAALGNFPQGFTHIGLINAAVTLRGARGRHQTPPLPARTPRERRHV